MYSLISCVGYLINKSIDVAEESKDPRYYADYYKLHKMLFYAQGEVLAEHDMPLFNEEIFAHECGPLVDNIDFLTLSYGFNKMTRYLGGGKLETPLLKMFTDILDEIVIRYGQLDRNELICLSKSEKVWIDARKSHFEKPVISKDNLKTYFRNKNSKVACNDKKLMLGSNSSGRAKYKISTTGRNKKFS